MERGTSIWLAVAGVGLLSVIGLGMFLGRAPADTAPPPTPASEPTIAAATGSEGAPSNARLPEDSPTPVPEDAWTTSETGLKIADLVAGEGDLAQVGAPVIVEYTGWLAATGEMFDSSKRRAAPLLFTLGHGDAPVPGWDEAVLGMRVGGKRQAILPPELAYGQTGRMPRIPRDATLILEFELKGASVAREAPDAPPPYNSGDLRDLDGVKVVDIELGSGRDIRDGDGVALDYSAFLQADQHRFDSSLTRQGPATFVWGRGEMLPGVERGIAGMKQGGTRVIVIPPDLGYGANGLRGYVPPDAALVFVVQVVEIGTP